MKIVQLTSSRFFGGPERQMIGLAEHLPERYETTFVSFAESGLCRPFLEEARSRGFATQTLQHDTPRLPAALRDLTELLQDTRAELLCCHGYKADLLGYRAARRAGIPVLAVSRGWTGENRKIRIYEGLDRRVLRRMDAVVCVSEGQAAKVRSAGVRRDRLRVIHNAIRMDRFAKPDPEHRRRLESFFPRPPRHIVFTSGRLSREKGIDVLIDAAALVADADPSVGFVIFGDGALRSELQNQIERLGLTDRVRLAGFRSDLDRLLPNADVVAVPSYTEGLPNVILEAFAAGVAVVATSVGGIPELVDHDRTGCLVEPGAPQRLAGELMKVLADEDQRRRFAEQARAKVAAQFTFQQQATSYVELFRQLALEPAVDYVPAEGRWPGISIVMPVLNEEAFIERTISQLQLQDYPADRVEIIIADGGSTDDTRAIVGRLAAADPRVRLVENPGRLSSAGRNAGLRAAAGEYIVIVDGHCDIEDTNFLQQTAAAFARSGADCLGRPQPQDVRDASALQQAIAYARASALGHHSASFIYADEERMVPAKSVAVAYRRSVFETVGPFDERFDACEDVELNHRVDQAGLRCFFTPRIRVRYFPRSSLSGLFRQLQRYGRGRIRLLRKHADTFSVASLLPAGLLVGLAAGPFAAWMFPTLWPVYASAALSYVALVLVFSLAITVQRGRWRLLPWLPLVYFTIHAGAGVGVLKEALFGAPTALRTHPDESEPERKQRTAAAWLTTQETAK